MVGGCVRYSVTADVVSLGASEGAEFGREWQSAA